MLDKYNNTNIIVWFSRQAGKTQNISDDIWFRAWNHMTSESHASKIYYDSQQNEYTSNNVTISKSCFVAKTVFSSGETWEQKLPDHDLLSHSTIGISKQILIIKSEIMTKTSDKNCIETENGRLICIADMTSNCSFPSPLPNWHCSS